MRTKVVAGSAILFLFCCNAVWAQWPNQTYGTRPTYEIELGASILDRPGSMQNTPLVTNSVTMATVFDAEQATDLNVSGGIDFRVQKMGCYDCTWEVRGYFNSWDVRHSYTGLLEAFEFTPPGVPPQTQLTAVDYDYNSELSNIELNFKRAVYPGCTLFIGPRYTNLREDAEIDANFIAPGLGNFLQTSTTSITKNNLLGLNLGAELRRPISRDLFVVASIRGAVYYNDAAADVSNSQTLFGFPLSTVTLLDDRSGVIAGNGEVSVKLHYDIAPGTVSIFAGYEAMWLDGVALAPAQILTLLGPPSQRVVETGTTIFANGLVIGGMVRF